jgi:hypothetical protein
MEGMALIWELSSDGRHLVGTLIQSSLPFLVGARVDLVGLHTWQTVSGLAGWLVGLNWLGWLLLDLLLGVLL